MRFLEKITEFDDFNVFEKFKDDEDSIRLENCQKAFMFQFGIYFKKKYLRNVLNNNENKEKLNFLEFVNLANKLRMNNSDNYDKNEILNECLGYLKRMDLISFNNRISCKQFIKIIKKEHFNMNQEVILNIFDLLDQNKDGFITLNDLETIID